MCRNLLSRRTATICLNIAAVLCLLTGPPVTATESVSGRTAGGAHYQIVVPDVWNGDLMIWNHGFSLGQPGPVEDIEDQFFLQLLEGYAVAASSYQLRGWAVFRTNQDLEELVDAFKANFGIPDRVIVSGASLGGIVTAAALEQADLGNVVGALTYCGILGGSRNWDAALDFRLLYDLTCAGMPGAQVPGGAKGLPKNTNLTRRDVEGAVNACTGVNLRKSQRSRKQKKNLKQLVKVGKIPESFIETVMWYSTFGMSDLVYDRAKLKGKLGVGNQNVDYGKAKINRTIQRVKPKRKAAKKLAKNFTPTGNVGDVKIVALHTSGDGLVFVENLGEYASVVPPANLTTAVAVENRPSHCLFNPAEVFAGWAALTNWINDGVQPTAADIQAECNTWRPVLGGACRFDPNYQIRDFDTRVRPR
jgi:hypothetical protein